MGAYRVRDLLLPPSLVSLARAPLAMAFPLLGDEPDAAMALLALAGATDVVDGWIARRYDLVTATGGVVDGVTDKLFAASVLVSLYAWGRLTPLDCALLATRELAELPLVVWLAASSRARRAREKSSMANALGKAATLLQFGAVGAVLLRSRAAGPLIVATGFVGAAAAFRYWQRALDERRSEPASDPPPAA